MVSNKMSLRSVCDETLEHKENEGETDEKKKDGNDALCDHKLADISENY